MTLERGDVVVCVARGGDENALVRCLAAIVAHTDVDVPVVVAGPASTRLPERAAARLAPGVASVEEALSAYAPADVCLVSERTVVAAGWLEGLRDAAGSDALVATATALSNHAAFLSLPLRDRPWRGLPQTATLDDAAARLRGSSHRLRPTIPAALPHCAYLRRSALELAGPGGADLTALSHRCVQRGLRHVAADDVFVLHAAPHDAPEEPTGYVAPELAAALAEAREDEAGPLARALARGRQALIGRRFTIDGRDLGVSGTQTLALVEALARTGEVRLRVMLPPDPPAVAVAAMSGLRGVETIAADTPSDVLPDDVAHRPFPVTTPHDAATLARFGERVVLTQGDLFGFRTPSYFENAAAWRQHRRVIRDALAVADLVVFGSAHARDDAVAEDLVEGERARVVPMGAERRGDAEPQRPARAPDGPFLLCLGTNLRHENHLFAIEVFAVLRERGWDGALVLTGPDAGHGSSAPEEAAWRLEAPEQGRSVVRLGSVGEQEAAWLYANASAVLHPSLSDESVAFAAATAGTPCLWAPVGALAEALPRDEAAIVPWDVDATADRAVAILGDTGRRAGVVEAVRRAGERRTWDRAALSLLEVYDETLSLPSPRCARAQSTQAAYWGLRHDIGDTGLALVGPGEPLLPRDAQRALAALARRGGTRSALLAALRLVERSRP